MIIKSFFSFSTRELHPVSGMCITKLKQKTVVARKQSPATAVNVYLLWLVDIVICYIEVDFAFGPLHYVRYM